MDIFDEKLFLIVGIVICYIIFILYSPIEDFNKPLDEDDIQANKTKSLVLLSIYVFIIAFASKYNLEYSNVILVTLLEVTLLMILGIIKKRGKGMKRSREMIANVLQNVGKSTIKAAVNSASFLYVYQEKEPTSLKEFSKRSKK